MPDGVKLLPWLVSLVDLVMIVAATVLAIRFRVSLPVFDSASDVLDCSRSSGFFSSEVVHLAAAMISGARIRPSLSSKLLQT